MSLQTDAVSSPSAQELKSRLADLQRRYDQLVAKNNTTVNQLQAKVQALQQQVRQQAEELALLRSSGSCAAGTHFTSTVSELLNRLHTEHEALLQRQLEDIRSSSHALNSAGAGQPVSTSQSQQVDDDESTVAADDHGDTAAASCAKKRKL